TESQIASDRSHRWNYQQRVIAWNLHAFTQGGFRPAAKLVIGPDHIGNENAVEGAVLQQLCQFGPVLQIVEAMPIIIWMYPHAMNDMTDAVHLEQIHMQLLGHLRPHI